MEMWGPYTFFPSNGGLAPAEGYEAWWGPDDRLKNNNLVVTPHPSAWANEVDTIMRVTDIRVINRWKSGGTYRIDCSLSASFFNDSAVVYIRSFDVVVTRIYA
jgi:hypothetical protein